ncbi:MAG: glycosyltransferase family 39 protein, partial [Alphaproteobacteria bacterium]|nr:glycosyltransferase family 39 protein [Alphaproteobacteria bacterium]
METSEKTYLNFIFVYLAAFALIPMVIRNELPYDMIENLHWGKELQLGYEKHPPLFAWISFFFYKSCFSWPESLYILTQLNLFVGLFFVFKISELLFNDRQKSWASVLVFMTSVCAVFGNEKFNANTILMALYPMMFYLFIRMIKFQRKTDAFALGVVGAAAVVGKYIALGYLGCMGLFLLLDKECRALLKTSLPYIAGVAFLIGISWHVVWMSEHNFITLRYALDKSTDAQKDYFSSFNFIGMQILFYATAFWAFAYSYTKKISLLPPLKAHYSSEENFILFISIVPQALLFFISLFTGMRIGCFWGTNMFMTLGAYLFILNKEEFDFDRLFKFAKIISVVFAVVLTAKLGIARLFLREYDPTNAINMRQVARCINEDWQKQFGDEKIKYVRTNKAVRSLHLFLKDSPSAYDGVHCDLYQIYNPYPYDKSVVAFMCKKDSDEIETFRNFYKHDILFENTTPIIND